MKLDFYPGLQEKLPPSGFHAGALQPSQPQATIARRRNNGGRFRKDHLFVTRNAAAIAYTLIENAKLNGVDPQAWLTYVLGQWVYRSKGSLVDTYRIQFDLLE